MLGAHEGRERCIWRISVISVERMLVFLPL